MSKDNSPMNKTSKDTDKNQFPAKKQPNPNKI